LIHVDTLGKRGLPALTNPPTRVASKYSIVVV
jgi:hypothetical protein